MTKKGWRAIFSLHPSWSLLGVGLLMILTVVVLMRLDTKPNTNDLALAVFQVSGTIIALVLPAAQLANGAITSLVNYRMPSVLNAREEDKPKLQKAAVDAINDAREHLAFAWWGSIYALFAFILSSLAAFVPSVTVFAICSFDLKLNALSLSGAFAFLLVGALLFFPTAWWAYNLNLARSAAEFFQNLRPSLPAQEENKNEGTENS